MKKFLFILIVSLLFNPLTSLAKNNTLPSGLTTFEIEKNVDDIMNKYIGKDIPGAALVIVKDGKVILEKGYGVSNIKNQAKVDPQKTVFEAGSISKVYTWSAVMQLVEQNKLDINEDIRTYLPKGFLKLSFSEKVTLLDLMHHTAGFEDKAEQLFTKNNEEVIPLENFVSAKYSPPKQVFRPSSVMAYSNYGTSLAGYIIERVSGEDFAHYMQGNVLNKLEMTHSSFASDYSELREIIDFKEEGYEKRGEEFKEVGTFYINDAPAGALNTTAADIGKFILAQLASEKNYLFKSPVTLKKMHEQSYQTHKNLPGNAHGFWERYINEHRVIEHGGNTIGYTSLLLMVPEETFGFGLLMNVANDISGIRVDLVQELIGEHKQLEEISSSKNDQVVTGTYRPARGMYTNYLKLQPLMSNGDIKVKQHSQGGITLKIPMDSKLIHYVETDDLLYEKVGVKETIMDKAGMDMQRIAFKLDKAGNVITMTNGVITDYLPVKIKDQVSLNIFIISISVLTFLVYIAVLLIQWGIRKKKRLKHTGSFITTSLLSSAGFAVVINISILFSRFIPDFFQRLAPLKIHLWINWLLPVAIIISGFFMIKQFKQTKLIINISRIYLLMISILFTAFLFNFHLLI